MSFAKRPEKDILIDLYVNQKLPVTKIAEIFDVDNSSVTHWLAKYDIPRHGSKLDLVGLEYENFSVIRYVGIDQRGRSTFECRCTCGKLFIACGSKIKSKTCISCGCIKKQYKTRRNKGLFKGIGDLSGSYFRGMERNAMTREHEFSVSKEYLWQLFVDQDRKCKLSGQSIKMTPTKDKEHTASLDRIDSRIGYVEENVQWVHKIINKMKQGLSDEEFIYYCKLVAGYNQ